MLTLPHQAPETQASGHAPSLDHAHFRRQEGETGPPEEQPGGHKLQPLFSDSGPSHKQKRQAEKEPDQKCYVVLTASLGSTLSLHS